MFMPKIELARLCYTDLICDVHFYFDIHITLMGHYAAYKWKWENNEIKSNFKFVFDICPNIEN